MSRYAAGTSVPMERSRLEVERTLQRYGASGFGYSWERRVVWGLFGGGALLYLGMILPWVVEHPRSALYIAGLLTLVLLGVVGIMSAEIWWTRRRGGR